MTAFVLFALCKALAHEMRLRRRVRALAFCELWGLALAGNNGYPELGPVVSGEYLNERTNKQKTFTGRDLSFDLKASQSTMKGAGVHCTRSHDHQTDSRNRFRCHRPLHDSHAGV